MAKKKKTKKHNFAHGRPSQSVAKPDQAMPDKPVKHPARPTVPSGPTAVAAYEVAHLPEIKADVRRVLVLAVVFVVLELVLWYLLEHTGLGPHVYNLVKL